MIKEITKRDGTLAPYNPAKFNLVIDYACDALEVESSKLKENLTGFLYDGIPTDKIQNLLIQKALTLISLEEPDWKQVCGRLVLLELYKNSKKTNGHDHFGYPDYKEFVKKAVEYGLYTRELTDNYSDAELDYFSKVIDPKYDLTYDYGRVVMFQKRYLLQYKGQAFELPQFACASVALMFAINLPKSTRLKKAAEYYHAIANRKISPATPVMLNLRVPNGNLASCFIMAMDDSLEAIFKTIDDAAQISKNAGGVGVNVSRVRGHKSWIGGVFGASGGVNPWIKLINDTAVAVNQKGKRAGAITVALDVWHIDILEFLDLQTENGDQRNKAYDVLLQVAVNDKFLQNYQKKVDWYLFDPYEVKTVLGYDLPDLYGLAFEDAYRACYVAVTEGRLKLFKKVNPSEIMKKILIAAMEVGTPYWFNKDTANEVNPNKHVGVIGNGNLCMESFTPFNPSTGFQKFIDDGNLVRTHKLGLTHVCNLISLVLPLINGDEELEYYTKLSIEMLDNLIDIGTPPVAEAQRHNDEMRILGLGVMGYHEHVTSKGIKYSESENLASELFENIAFWSVDKSCELARDRGQYKHYEGSEWSKGIFYGKHVSCQLSDRWVELYKRMQKYGLRNGGLMAIAPNTSTSIFIGVGASVLPAYDVFFHDNNSMGSFPVIPCNIKEPGTLWLYETFKNIDQKKIIDVCAAMQGWIDQGISMELMLNLDKVTSATEVRDLYLHAWKKKCKTVYYLRTKKKSADNECSVCAN